jgi:hypothetical protein
MIVSTHFGDLQTSQAAKDEAADLMRQVTTRFHSRIREVAFNIRNVNGPKGGVDKHCRCVVYLKGMPAVIIEDADENYRTLLYRVADRLSYTLGKRMDRSKRMVRSRRARQKSIRLGGQQMFDHALTA